MRGWEEGCKKQKPNHLITRHVRLWLHQAVYKVFTILRIYSCCTARIVIYATLTAQADADSNQQPESSKARHATHSATRLGIILTINY
jgi:hypothetical protein